MSTHKKETDAFKLNESPKNGIEQILYEQMLHKETDAQIFLLS